MAGVSDPLATKVLNATTPTGGSAAPGTWSAYTGGAMKVRLNSTASTASAIGTEITGTGYTAGGANVPEAVDASSGGSAVTIPKTTVIEWTNGSGGNWSIVSFDLTTSDAVRTWFGNFTGQPITVANGNKFQIAVAGISIDVS